MGLFECYGYLYLRLCLGEGWISMKKTLKKGEKGQAMVEFAILLPLLLLLVCGIIDFAWLAYNQLSLNNACREAARYAIVNIYDDDQLTTVNADIKEEVSEKVMDEAPDIFKNGIQVKLVFSNEAKKEEGDLTVYCSTTMNIFTPVLGTINGSQKKMITSKVTMKVES